MANKNKTMTEYGQMLQHIETVTKYIADLEKSCDYYKRVCYTLGFFLQTESDNALTAYEWVGTAERWMHDFDKELNTDGV